MGMSCPGIILFDLPKIIFIFISFRKEIVVNLSYNFFLNLFLIFKNLIILKKIQTIKILIFYLLTY